MNYNAKDKYYSMKRAFERFEKINTDNGNSISNADPKDSAEDFFNQCYHLKDWIKKDLSLTLSSDIEKFIKNSSALSIASDYCNSQKHAGLDRWYKPKSGQTINQINTHIKFDLTQYGFIASGRLELTVGNKKYDAFSLAKDCIKEWDSFLLQNNIKF